MRLDNPLDHLYKSIDIVGFTGTQKGLTKAQRTALRTLLSEMEPRVLVHGDCIGADAEAHDIATKLGIEPWLRPCIIEHKRAFKQGKILADPEPPLVRNHKIVDNCHALIGCPGQHQPQLRSGTWATLRYAKKQDVLRWIVYPDGSILTPLDA